MSNFLKDIGQPIVYKAIHPFVQWMARVGITPNMITMIGFVLNIVAAAIFVWGGIQTPRNLSVVGWGGAMILFAGLFDMIDGRLARISGKESQFGALFDSVLDRYSELVMFLGICYYLVSGHYLLSSLGAFVAMIGSIMVSYVRARAEGLGVECKGGFMQRPERVLTVGISAILCGLLDDMIGTFKYTIPGSDFPIFESISVFTLPLFLMAILTNFTAIQRMKDAKKALEGK
jgi:phosphatidylglycerophosphate synthase